MLSILLSAFLAYLPLASDNKDPMGPGMLGPEPTVNLSAVRYIKCDDGDGSGFMIGPNKIATAYHVASAAVCKDAETGSILKRTHSDPEHDFAIMEGLLPDIPAIKVSCKGYAPGWVSAYGYSAFLTKGEYPWFRQVDLKVGRMESLKMDDIYYPMRRLTEGYVVYGMSGGPHIQKGAAVGLTNVLRGFDFLGRPYIRPLSWGTELKDTILCNRPVGPNTPQTH